VKIHRCASGGKGGGETQAIGVTKGGRSSKVHAVVDEEWPSLGVRADAGNTAYCVVAETCVSLIPGITELVPAFLNFPAWLTKFPARASELPATPQKFPAQLFREFGLKPLKLLADWAPK
jgi:hypothetical protein